MSGERKRWHFGVLSFTGTGHLNPMIALCQELKTRGHRITFFEKPKIEARIRESGLEFVAIGNGRRSTAPTTPPPKFPPSWHELSTLRLNIARVTSDVRLYLEETPPALCRTKVDALIVNEIALAGPTIAESLGLPYFVISTSVPHNFGWNSYPWYAGYRASTSWISHLETALLQVSALRMRGPIRGVIDSHRRRLHLGPLRRMSAMFPPLAHITQFPACMDLPRARLPKNFFYTGPFLSKCARPHVEFPWHLLDGRPIIYATLGTTRNAQSTIYRMIAHACKDLDVQLVISLGGRFDAESLARLPGHPVIVRYAPQLALLQSAALVITHAGPNTAFESLLAGKPMVAIPLAHDQPAIAARLDRLKVARVLPVVQLSPPMIRRAVAEVSADLSYRQAAEELQKILLSLRGSERAADLMEEALNRFLPGAASPAADESTHAL